MTTSELTATSAPSPGSDIRRMLGGRRSLIAAAAALTVAGLAFNWTWLVAAGIAPLLISVLPCVAMCALGLCMNRMTGRACPTDNVSPEGDTDGTMKGNG